MDLDVGAQRAAELLNCLTVVTFTSNKYHVLHGTRAIPTAYRGFNRNHPRDEQILFCLYI